MGVKKQKLIAQFSEQADNEESEGNIFSGVAIFVNGWTNPSMDELKRIMMTYGGVFHHYQNHRTTHIIASNLPDVKVRALKGDEKIVKPEWITASVKAGKLLDYSNYLLYTHQSKNQPKISFKQMPNTSSGAISSDANKENDNSKWVAKDATDSRFLGEFFNNSRLHHIATMGANAKDYVSNLRSQHNGSFPARDSLQDVRNTGVNDVPRTIMHIDMDCFFVSVGLVSRPDLRGRPVVVTHARGNKQSQGQEQDQANAERRRAELAQYRERLEKRSGNAEQSEEGHWKLDNIDGTSSMAEIASCSYEARAKGVKNGMFLGPALRLCPDLVPIPYDFTGYETVSRVLYDTVASYTVEIMAVSCDEMFVDLTGLCTDLKMDPLAFVTKLREEIFTKTGCPCSVGLGPNILLARVATKKAKPNGQFLLTEETAGDLLSLMKASELPGVGRSMEHKLSNLGVTTVGDLLTISLARLQQEFGHKTGLGLYNMARGKDDRQLELDHVRKTVSAEVNYGIRFKSWDDAEQFLQQLAEEVSNRLVKLGLLGRNVTLKLMVRAENAPEETAKYNGHGVCDNISRSAQLHQATSSREIIFKEVFNLVKMCKVKPNDLRGVGITMSKLERQNSKKVSSNSSILKFMKTKTDLDQTDDTSSINSEASTSFFNSPLRRNPFKVSKAEPENPSLPTEVDPSVWQNLPSDVQAEILSDYKSSETKEQNEKQTNESELDPDVLDQLPPDIRAEVEAQYNVDKNKPSTSFKPSPSKPSTSKINPEEKEVVNVENPIEEDNSNSCDISFSQVDQDVLSELPADLQLELTRHFARNKNKTNLQQKSKSAFDAIMSVKNSPTKSTSPTKTVKGKRGRKKGSVNNDKKIRTESSTTMSPKKTIKKIVMSNNIDLEDNNSVDMEVFNALPEDIKSEVEAQMKRNEAKETKLNEVTFEASDSQETDNRNIAGEEKPNNDTKSSTPTFCGKTSIEDIRPLLKEWISSTDVPAADDINMLADFLASLIKSWNLDLVQILLKCLHRNISKLNRDVSASWRLSWQNLVTQVQNVMLICYGNPLFIAEKF